MPADVDPRLKKVLDGARPDTSVRALITFGSEALSPSDAVALAEKILAHAAERTSKSPRRQRVMPGVQSISLEADADFLESLLSEGAVTTAELIPGK